MSLFARLFGSSDARLAKRIIKDSEGRVTRATKPLTDLATAIVSASQVCYKNLKRELLSPDQREEEFALWAEFICFFMHLTMRFTASMDTKQIQLLQSFLGPSMSYVAVNTFCAHWPEELKAKIKSEFCDRLNQAEVEYSTSRQLYSEQNPITGDSLFSKLGRNVAELSGHPMDLAAIMQIMVVATTAYKEMNLASLLQEAGKVLSEPSNHDIVKNAIDFWAQQ